MYEGHGVTITMDSGFLAEILDISGPSMSRESIETSHQGTTTAKTFIKAALYDAGELSVTLGFDPSTRPPIDDDAESIVITIPAASGSGSSTLTFTGFMTGFEPKIPMGDKMTADVTIKVAGDITFA